MENELTKRQALAEQVMAAYAAQPKVAAVLLAGSVARGTADRFSDIEVDVVWAEEPSDDERLAPIAALGLTPHYVAADENEWADGLIIGGVKVDTSQFRQSTVEQWIDDVLTNADTDMEKHLLIAAIQHGTPFHNAALIEAWRERAASFPDALMYALLEENLQFRPRFLLEMLAEREDELFLRQCVVQVAQRVMGSLLALNRQYQAHPAHKWQRWQIELLPIKPAQLDTRLRYLLRAEGHTAASEAHALIDETFDLVERYAPGYDAAPARGEFDDRRHGQEVANSEA